MARRRRPVSTDPPPAPRASLKTDDPDLKELHEAFDYATDAWRDIREEAKIDMRYIGGDPWHPDDRTMRENAGRPVIAMDELGQYVNQIVNDVRQNKRAIKVTPLGNGANDQTAALRADLFRQIEYRSNAQQAYTTMFENAVQRSYGYLRVKPQFVSARSRHQELIIEPIMNPDLVTPDPDAIRPDVDDMKYLFNQESWSQTEFKKQFPKAKVQDFSTELMGQVPRWVKDERIMLAEWWRITMTPKRLVYFDVPARVQPGQPPQPPRELDLFEDELDKKPEGARIVGDRMADVPVVTKCLTNGIEILEEETWPGRYIPFVACFGKILYVDSGAGPEKTILSAIRLARDPEMLYCYCRTAEAEEVGMSTRFPYFVREGSLSNAEADKLAQSTHEPVAFIQVKATSDNLPPGQMPEMPVRNPFEPAIAALETGAEATRRAIQAAMGISPLPTNMQRDQRLSGVSQKELESSAQKGTFHFVDHYEAAITRTAVIVDDLIQHYYDAARDLVVRKPDDTPIQVRVNDPAQPVPQGPEAKPSPYGSVPTLTDGEHDMTLSSGPDFASEREAANDYADTLVQNLQTIAAVSGPQAAAKVMALSVKLKDIGPLGQEMADIISPQDQPQIPPHVQAMVQQLQQQNQELKAAADANQTKVAIAQEKNEFDLQIQAIKAQTSITVAEIGAKSAQMVADVKAQIDVLAQLIGTAHEERLAEKEHAHTAAQTLHDASHEAAMSVMEHQQSKEIAQMPPPVDPNQPELASGS